MTRTVINAGTVLTLDDADQVHTPGHIEITDGLLTAVGPGPASGVGVMDLSEHVIMPGLVNTHTHTPMALLRGVAEGHSLLTLRGWYDTVRVLEEHMSADLVGAAIETSLMEITRTGTTCFADQYFYMPEVVPRVRASGLRAALAHGIVELDDAAAQQRELAHARDLLAEVANDELIDGWVGPHALLVDNKEDTVLAEVALAQEFGTGLHTHFATSGEEQRLCQERYGRNAVDTFEQLGILDVPVLLAHGLDINPADFPVLARHPSATVVIAATVCMASGATAPPLRAYLDAGVHCALGTDNVCNNNSYDMFEEMRTVSRLMSFAEQRPNAVSSREILRLATTGGARALGLQDRIGSLQVGKAADVIAIHTSTLRRGPSQAQSIHSTILFGTTAAAITHVAVRGEWLVDAGHPTRLEPNPHSRLEHDFAALERRRADASRRPPLIHTGEHA